MLVTEFGIVMLTSPVQPENASFPMLFTVAKLKEVSPVHPENALLPTLSILPLMVIF